MAQYQQQKVTTEFIELKLVEYLVLTQLQLCGYIFVQIQITRLTQREDHPVSHTETGASLGRTNRLISESPGWASPPTTRLSRRDQVVLSPLHLSGETPDYFCLDWKSSERDLIDDILLISVVSLSPAGLVWRPTSMEVVRGL